MREISFCINFWNFRHNGHPTLLLDSQSQILILSLFYTNILYIYSIRQNLKGYRFESGIVISAKWVQGRIKEFVKGGIVFFLSRWAQTIDFTGPWGEGLAPIAPPPEYASEWVTCNYDYSHFKLTKSWILLLYFTK